MKNGKLLGKLSDAHNENGCQNNSTLISTIWHTPSPWGLRQFII